MSSPDGVIQTEQPLFAVGQLPDAELEDRLKRLAGIERKALVMLLAHLGEFDERRLHAERGHPSMFAYCLRVLGYSEQAAYKRIQAARAARLHPEILRRLADSELTLTAVVILSPHLRVGNVRELLDAARGMRTREVEALASGLAPRPDSPDFLRALPTPPGHTRRPEAALQDPGPAIAGDRPASTDRPSESGVAHYPQASQQASRTEPPVRAPRERIKPLSPRRHLFRFTGSSELLGKYERALELMSAARSRSSMEMVIEAGLDAFLDKRAPERRIARRKARAPRRGATHCTSRRISMGLRDAVWERDGGRCTFTGPDGARCPSTTRLEIDHIRPYALGGSSDDAENLRVMCRAHNQLLARRIFGPKATHRQGHPES